MSTHRTLPSEIEPERLDDLIADCAVLSAGMIDLTELAPAALPHQRLSVVIDDDVVHMLDGLGDYGS